MVILEVLLESIIKVRGTEARKGISPVWCYPISHCCGRLLLNPPGKSGSGSDMAWGLHYSVGEGHQQTVIVWKLLVLFSAESYSRAGPRESLQKTLCCQWKRKPVWTDRVPTAQENNAEALSTSSLCLVPRLKLFQLQEMKFLAFPLLKEVLKCHVENLDD